jgi:hypothetical protein
VFGRALRNIVCALRRNRCADCLLAGQCVYARFFEVDRDVPGAPTPPHPFVIEPPSLTGTHYPAGTPLSYHLLLFGEVNAAFPYFLYAFERMGEIGIGRRIDGKRGTYALERVEQNGAVVYTPKTRRLQNTGPPEILPPPPVTTGDESNGPRTLTVTFETPFRVKHENRLFDNTALPFPVLIRAALRRVVILYTHYSDTPPDYPFQTIIQNAESIEIVQHTIKWQANRGYSARQKRELSMGGLTGAITYAGNIAPYLPLLRFCERVHIGKQTTYGLGKIRITPPDPAPAPTPTPQSNQGPQNTGAG